MRKDQIFVLMLVIFLPLTGCFGDAIGEAEADEGTEENSNSVTNDGVMSIHIDNRTTYNVTVNGTTLELLEAWHIDYEDRDWRQGGSVTFKMECANGFEMQSSIAASFSYPSTYMPILPDVECDIEFNYRESWSGNRDYSKILVFKEHSLTSL